MKKIWILILLLIVSTSGGSHNPAFKKVTLSGRVALTAKVEKFDTLSLIQLESVDINKQMNLRRFKEKMGYLESRGNYRIVNKFGYMGKYQFGKATLKSLARRGYIEPVHSYAEFLNNVELQEKAMDALIKYNTEYIYKHKLNLYIGKKINSTKITMNGMLAAAHLVGARGMRQFIQSGGRIIRKDGNNTTVVDYLKRFENEV